MHAKRAMPLSLRVASIYAMLVAATLLVAAGLALQFTRNQLSSQVDYQLNILAKSFQNRVPDAVKAGVASGQSFTDALVSGTKVWLSDASFFEGGGAIVAIRNLPPPNLFQATGVYDLADELPPAALSVPTGKWLNLKGRTGVSIRALRIPITDPHGDVAGILLVGATQSKVVNHAVWNLLKGIGAASAIGFVFATTLGLFAVRRTLRPLEEMSHEVESIQETDDLSKRLSGRGPRDEVGRLAEGFDRMRSMSIAIEELDRMGRIVEDLLLLARLDEGMPLARDSVEVELVVGEALLRAMLGSGDVRVQVLPELCILGDADRLLQVLTNLITNAVRHGRNAPITVTGRPEGDYVRIEVSDRGPGISPEDLPHVFERLYRGSKARSESPGGAGLGLAIALSLVKAMDGWLDVDSTLGVGTTFTVTLPSAAPVGSYRMPARQRREATAL